MAKYRIHEQHFTPSFRGIHNRIKTRAWLCLWDARLGTDKRLGIFELASESKVPYRSLGTLLPRWTRLDYVSRTGRRSRYQYRITKKGIRWLQRRLQDSVETINEILAELEKENDK